MINVHQVYMLPAITKKNLLTIRTKRNMSRMQAGMTLAIKLPIKMKNHFSKLYI